MGEPRAALHDQRPMTARIGRTPPALDVRSPVAFPAAPLRRSPSRSTSSRSSSSHTRRGCAPKEIRKTLGLDVREVPRILKDGLAEKKLKSKGQKRATTYFSA